MKTRASLGLVVVLLAAGAHAQALRDPTRPPGIPASRAVGGAASASGGLVLQSILMAPDRQAAVISGKVLAPGESIDGFMLVGIAEGEAVLKNGGQVRRLRLYPGVDMRRQKEGQDGEGAATTAPAGTQ